MLKLRAAIEREVDDGMLSGELAPEKSDEADRRL